jgi:hypothetical protein
MTAAELRKRVQAARSAFVPKHPCPKTHFDPELVAQEYDVPLSPEPAVRDDRQQIARLMRNLDRDNGTRPKPGERSLQSNT